MNFPSFLFLTALVFCLLLVSCGNASEENSEMHIAVQDLEGTYGNKEFTVPQLSERALMYVAQWSVYEDFENDAKTISGSTLEKLRNTSERLVQYSDSLSKKIPDTLNNSAISSRLTVVKTRANLLLQEANKSRIDSLKLENAITEMNKAVKNLIVQINEKFQKDAIDLQRKEDEEKELEKQKRFLDSVYKAELKDKMNN